MKPSSVPSFSSPELQRAVEAAHPYIAGLDEARNKISADIKSLEEYLAASGLKTEFSYSLGPQDAVSATPLVVEEHLLWATDRSTGKFRLLYEPCRWLGFLFDPDGQDPLYPDPSILESERKPLIETKIEVRMKMHEHLPAFVRELALHLGAKDVEEGRCGA